MFLSSDNCVLFLGCHCLILFPDWVFSVPTFRFCSKYDHWSRMCPDYYFPSARTQILSNQLCVSPQAPPFQKHQASVSVQVDGFDSTCAAEIWLWCHLGLPDVSLHIVRQPMSLANYQLQQKTWSHCKCPCSITMVGTNWYGLLTVINQDMAPCACHFIWEDITVL